jgi:hypothetical protein
MLAWFNTRPPTALSLAVCLEDFAVCAGSSNGSIYLTAAPRVRGRLPTRSVSVLRCNKAALGLKDISPIIFRVSK